MSKQVSKRKDKLFSLKPFSFQYVEITTNQDVIKGGGLYLSGRLLLTIARCNNLWIDEKGRPYNFKVDDGILFLRRIAISLG